jgi:hypothetical protein
MQVAAVISLVVAVGVAIAAIVTLRDVRPHDGSGSDDASDTTDDDAGAVAMAACTLAPEA